MPFGQVGEVKSLARLLNDKEIRGLLGSVICDGDSSSVRPNSYVMRLGAHGEFLNTGKQFELAEKVNKGIRIPPGHSVGVTALEKLDFRRETVRKIYPDGDLHGFLSPTTDLAREGIGAPTTQVDAGYTGTLNWTLMNSSGNERKFVLKERIYRLSIFLLEPGESPDGVYEGHYQNRLGYVPSERAGPPVGMKDKDWVDAYEEGGPERLLDDLINSGYPWHLLGSRLKQIDQQFRTVTEEYAEIRETMGELSGEIQKIRNVQDSTPDRVRGILRDETSALQNRWLIGTGSILLGTIGALLTVFSNEAALSFVDEYGIVVGIAALVSAGTALTLVSRQK